MDTICIDKDGLVYIGFWRRVGAYLLDALILLPLMIPYMLTYKYFITNKTVLPIITYYFLFYGIQIFIIVRFGGSPGKLILKYRIINEKGGFLTVPKAILRASLDFPSTNPYFIYMGKDGIIVNEPLVRTGRKLQSKNYLYFWKRGICYENWPTGIC